MAPLQLPANRELSEYRDWLLLRLHVPAEELPIVGDEIQASAAIAKRVEELAVQDANELALRDRAATAIENLEAAWAGWSGLTVAQKDAAAKLSLRVTIALARLTLRRFDKT